MYLVKLRFFQETIWTWINWNRKSAPCSSGTDDIFHISFLICPQPLLLLPFFFLLYSLLVLSDFWELLPLLLRFCWPWNQRLMWTQRPRAEPTCCIQMGAAAIIRPFPALHKHSFNILSSRYQSAHFQTSDGEMLQAAAASTSAAERSCRTLQDAEQPERLWETRNDSNGN